MWRLMFSIVDGRVVDQDANGESKAAERHDIDGLAKQGKRGQRTQTASGIETVMMEGSIASCREKYNQLTL